MSSNRLIYDTCAYKKRLDESTSPLQYHLNPLKYENCNKCRVELGVSQGPSSSQIKGNLIDLENELRGQTRLLSNCDSRKYRPGQKIYNSHKGIIIFLIINKPKIRKRTFYLGSFKEP